ncbi:MAG TPA: hypothetical protein VLM40_12825 [Gemmata sp.]|nr:hypothetical protein [Gemmata sp.]
MRHLFPSRRGTFLAALTLLCTTLLLAGCGKSSGSVSGKVSYQGKALKGGSVSFVSEDGGRSFAGPIKEDGTYTIPDLLSGEYKVCVETSSLNMRGGQKGPKYAGSSGGKAAIPTDKGPPPGAPIPEGYTPSNPAAAKADAVQKRFIPIPDKYAKPDTTDITYSFKGGNETYNIDLK